MVIWKVAHFPFSVPHFIFHLFPVSPVTTLSSLKATPKPELKKTKKINNYFVYNWLPLSPVTVMLVVYFASELFYSTLNATSFCHLTHK